jgi:hypothetical protein
VSSLAIATYISTFNTKVLRFSNVAQACLQQKCSAEILAFNEKLESATKGTNNEETMALWADDGISLLPSTKPLIGKTAISAFLDLFTAQLKGAKMDKFEIQCHAISGSGNWASEWCDEHQVVLLPGENRHLTAGERSFSSWLNKPKETGGSNAKCGIRNSKSRPLGSKTSYSPFATRITATQPTGKITK